MTACRRPGVTLLELLIVVAVVALLVGLLLAAVQKVRAAAIRLSCQHHLKQITLGLHAHHDAVDRFPSGMRIPRPGEAYPRLGWLTRLLPHLEQNALWEQTTAAYANNPSQLFAPPHPGLATPVKLFACPADVRSFAVQITHGNKRVALTNYLGVSGVNCRTTDGVLFANSRVRIADITDGTSNTLAVGERPPGHDFWYGWWYAGEGQSETGSGDTVLGVRELRIVDYFTLQSCPRGPYRFAPGRVEDPCMVLRFWSLDADGGHFAFADGSVRFLSYSAEELLPALAAKAGGEVVALP